MSIKIFFTALLTLALFTAGLLRRWTTLSV